ncbi:hypothetical protein [Aureimonas sp. SK2]|uniref:hypothetical protein n=1 Tax=Aureimonas sp. SK2 TaxID=3015992 RepID=UPI002443FC83|nr:hypothetical protein [Aureimonas sp. SK2]
MTEREINILFEIGLAKPGTGKRLVGMDPTGTAHVFTVMEGQQTASPIHSFTSRDAVTIARMVMSGHERAVTDSANLRVLAAAVLLLDQQLGNVQSIVEGAADVEAEPAPVGRFDPEMEALDL